MRQLHADQALVHAPEQLAVFERDGRELVERADDIGIGLQAERAQENSAVELALAVDTDIQQVLVVVFELDPAAAIRNDLAEEVALRLHAFEEHARRTMQLRNNHALGAVDDERAVIRHQRNFAEENFLFFDVANSLVAGLRVFVVDRQADGDFERRRIGHAALFALGHIVLQLQGHGIAAAITERDDVLVERAALVAEHIAGMERIGADFGTAVRIAADGAKVMQTLQIAALALPVADRVIDKLELAQARGNRRSGKRS